MTSPLAASVFTPADILLPKDTDLTRWSVIACDQFTSDPAYWQEVAALAEGVSSAYKLIIPENYLEHEGVEGIISGINRTASDYLAQALFECHTDSMIYVERIQSDGKLRRGLIGKVDLEQYDYTPGSSAFLRASEGTVLSRIPPRVKVRRDAPIELPHIMLLADDPEKQVIEPLAGETASMKKLYDFELQQGGGHIRGYLLTEDQKKRVSAALCALADPALTAEKYDMPGASPLLFVAGDGNHSLATAKTCYEAEKAALAPGEENRLLSRYALAELVNLHDDALVFEPIHRVLFGVKPEAVLKAFREYYPSALEGQGEGHVIRYVSALGEGYLTVPDPAVQLPVGTLQEFLDTYVQKSGCKIDYIHDDDTAVKLGCSEDCLAFLLPAMGKDELFKTVMADGVLPRKTFSMGHARDKRYYLEARRIK